MHTCCTCGTSLESWQVFAVTVGPDGLGGTEVKRACSAECAPKDVRAKAERLRRTHKPGVRTFGVE